jgi:hypothetical protein
MATFHTIADSELKPRNGQPVEVLGTPDPSTYDAEETGPMFRIRFPDGFETDAFEDEIKEN